MKHTHWEFIAYDGAKDNMLLFPVEVLVKDQPIEALALEQAKKIVQRKNYYLKKVFECTSCANEEEQLKILNSLKNHLD